MNFEKSIFEYKTEKGAPLLVAHRGVCGANIPCNTLTAYKIAVDQGADVVEIDVSISKDGKYYVFHPGMERVFLGIDRRLSDMTGEEIDQLYLLNQDKTPTGYRIPKLCEVLELLRGRAYINVDKFWTDVEGITREIRRAGVEKQVIIKTGVDEKTLSQVREHASDLMFIPIIKNDDGLVDKLIDMGINVIGAEVLFDSEDSQVISDEYIASMHERELLVWVNSIIYDEKAVLSAGHSDDVALRESPDKGWGWLVDKGVDMIQTDWLLALNLYIKSRNN